MAIIKVANGKKGELGESCGHMVTIYVFLTCTLTTSGLTWKMFLFIALSFYLALFFLQTVNDLLCLTEI